MAPDVVPQEQAVAPEELEVQRATPTPQGDIVDLSDRQATLALLRGRHLVPENAEFVNGAQAPATRRGIHAVADYESEMEGLRVSLSCAEGFGNADLSSQICFLWVHALGAPHWGAARALLFDRGRVLAAFGPSSGVRWRVTRDPFFHVVVADSEGAHSEATYETVYRIIDGQLTPTLRVETEFLMGVDPEYPERDYRRASWAWHQGLAVATGRTWPALPDMSQCVQSVRSYDADSPMPPEHDGGNQPSLPESERLEPCAAELRGLHFSSFRRDRCHAMAPVGTFCDSLPESPAADPARVDDATRRRRR